LAVWMLEGILMSRPLVGCYGIRIQQLVRFGFCWIMGLHGKVSYKKNKLPVWTAELFKLWNLS